MSDLSALIERLSKASGKDRWLDFCIREAVEGWKNVGGGYREWPDGRRESHSGIDPNYTESIDAALTLVPEGWGFEISNRAPDPHKGRAWIHNRQLINTKAYRGAETTAATPALALCASALRARQTQGE